MRRKIITKRDTRAASGLVGALVGLVFQLVVFIVTLPFKLIGLLLSLFGGRTARAACDMCGSPFAPNAQEYHWDGPNGRERVCANCNALMRKRASAAAVKARFD